MKLVTTTIVIFSFINLTMAYLKTKAVGFGHGLVKSMTIVYIYNLNFKQ